MKKFLFIGLCLLGTALTASAQLQVAENGKVYIQRPATDTIASLSIGDSPYFDNETHEGCDMGLFIHKYGPSNRKTYFGIFSEAISNGSYSTAVYGEALGGLKKFGVVGSVTPSNSGAGLCGTDEYGYLPPFSGLYGGFIYDDLYVDGNIITTLGLYNTSDMRLNENVTLMSEREEERGASALDNIQRIDVLEYNLRRPSQVSQDTEGTKREMTAREKAALAKRHFGISAQELQNTYPELVEENQEGYLMVNYVELVPLLIRSIQELKTELDELKGNNDSDGNSAARRESRLSNSADSRVSPVNATLYQNTPNPFTAQTEIRFSLPDNALQAYIYIFDMTGKMQKQIPVDPNQKSVTISGYELQAGIYLYSLVVGGQEIDTKRMIITK